MLIARNLTEKELTKLQSNDDVTITQYNLSCSIKICEV